MLPVRQNILSELPVHLQKFAELRISHKPFSFYSKIDKGDVCVDIVTVAHANCGDKGDDSELITFQASELQSCLKEKYSSLTVEEIKKALDMLIAGEFGAFFGLNKKAYYQALKGYFELPQRTEAVKCYLQLQEPKPMEITPEEKKKLDWDSCVWCFNEYKKTGIIPAGHFKFYQTLMNLGLIKWTNEERKEISTPIKAQYEKEIDSDYKRGRITKLNLADIMTSLDSNPTLIGRIRKVALARYFDQLISKGIELESLQVEV